MAQENTTSSSGLNAVTLNLTWNRADDDEVFAQWFWANYYESMRRLAE